MTAGAVGVRGFAGKQRMPYAALREGTQFYRDIYIHMLSTRFASQYYQLQL